MGQKIVKIVAPLISTRYRPFINISHFSTILGHRKHGRDPDIHRGPPEWRFVSGSTVTRYIKCFL